MSNPEMSSDAQSQTKIFIGLTLPHTLLYFAAAEEAQDPCRMELDPQDLVARLVEEDRDFCIPFTHPAFGMCYRCMSHGGNIEIIQETRDANGAPRRCIKKYYYSHSIADIVATKKKPEPSTAVTEAEGATDGDTESS